MKRLSLLAALVGVSAGLLSADTFSNGNFETGTFDGWTQGSGYLTSGQTTNNLVPGSYLPAGTNFNISANASAIVSPGLDPNTDNHLNMVYSGKYSERVNDGNPDYSVSVISQTVNN